MDVESMDVDPTADRPDGPDDGPGEGPAALRQAFAAYVAALHEAYVEAAGRVAPDAVAALPLAGEPFVVAVVAAPQLHIVATRDELPARAAHEEPLWGELDDLRWELRFLDVTVVPALGRPSPPDVEPRQRVLDALRIRGTLYHLILGPDATLTPHHAMHAGTGLANAHLGGAR
jgi:hypothetical protein